MALILKIAIFKPQNFALFFNKIYDIINTDALVSSQYISKLYNNDKHLYVLSHTLIELKRTKRVNKQKQKQKKNGFTLRFLTTGFSKYMLVLRKPGRFTIRNQSRFKITVTHVSANLLSWNNVIVWWFNKWGDHEEKVVGRRCV